MSGLSLVAVSGGYFLFVMAFLVAEHGLQGVQAQEWRTGLVAPGHVESSQSRDRTCVACISRQILNHWTTREVQHSTFFSLIFLIEGQLLYRIMLFSVKPQHESVIGIHMSPLS